MRALTAANPAPSPIGAGTATIPAKAPGEGPMHVAIGGAGSA